MIKALANALGVVVSDPAQLKAMVSEFNQT